MADPEFSLLVTCVLQQALKVACSDRLPSESRTWVAAYTATVLSQLLHLQTDAQAMCSIVIGLFQQAADTIAQQQQQQQQDTATAQTHDMTGAEPPQHASNSNSNHAEHAGTLQLPVEAQPLVSLFNLAVSVLHNWQRSSAFGVFNTDQSPSNIADASKHVAAPSASSGKKRKQGEQSAASQSSVKKQRKAAGDQAADAGGSNQALKVLSCTADPKTVSHLASQPVHRKPVFGTL